MPDPMTDNQAMEITEGLDDTHPSLELCVQFSDDGQHIRKWSRIPFEGGECLYSHPATPAAGDAEVERVVAWLRKPLTYVRGISMAQQERIADAIERGVHHA